MILLFNINDTGTTEIKAILGFIDASIKFADLHTDLRTSTDELIKIIGQPMYDSLIGIYSSDSASSSDKEFVLRAQTAIAIDAYRNYAISSDMSHTPNGRVNRVETNEKIAFEWQIERSNKAMERKYYKAVDALINFMDNSVSGWKTSEAYKATHELFVRTPSTIDDFFNIDGSRLLMIKLIPGIRKKEREEILPRIGKVLFDQLKAKLKSNQEVDSDLLYIIQAALTYSALSWAIVRMSAQLFPEGVLQVADTSRLTTSARKAAERNEADSLSQRFASDAEKEFLKLEEYMAALNKPDTVIPDAIKPNFNQCDGFVDT